MEIYSKERIEGIYGELVDGIRKYANEHGFTKAVLGLSGGIDSAVTCCLAAEALGPDNVLGIAMPSKYSSAESEEYAGRLASNLGIEFRIVPISAIYDSYLNMLEKELGGRETEKIEIYHQNIQARIRGNILMAYSNRFGYLVLATGNKSEAMMGYCTLYGDTVGGLAVISDVLKAGVYGLAEHINRDGEIIPKSIIDRVPSAELKPGQADHDSLPPYDILDEILYWHLDKDFSAKEIEEKGFDPETVNNVISTIKTTEYKRMQCPRGIKTGKKINERIL
ncbi:MAG: NAD(+) synthase [Candidatus Omnitrophota bacterium]|nr:NAD(+) synthase [Candidatus Omnitrophota bacterium]